MCVFVCAETETELNVEVAFSEQALTYRDNHQRSKVTSPKSPDDKLPVSLSLSLSLSFFLSHTHTHANVFAIVL